MPNNCQILDPPYFSLPTTFLTTWYGTKRYQKKLPTNLDRKLKQTNVADPGSGAFLTPGSGIRNRFYLDPGSQTHIFESLVAIFGVKSSIIL